MHRLPPFTIMSEFFFFFLICIWFILQVILNFYQGHFIEFLRFWGIIKKNSIFKISDKSIFGQKRKNFVKFFCKNRLMPAMNAHVQAALWGNHSLWKLRRLTDVVCLVSTGAHLVYWWHFVVLIREHDLAPLPCGTFQIGINFLFFFWFLLPSSIISHFWGRHSISVVWSLAHAF